MKKAIAYAAAAVLALGTLAGCSAGKSESSGKLSVVTTVFPAYDFARQVFGDTADVTLLLKPGMESHSYDPSAKDIVKISECDLFIYNGGESDQWVNDIISSTDIPNTLRMMDCVEAIQEEITEGMEHDHDEHDDHDEDEEEYDEHIWTSPKNAAKICEAVKQAACVTAPENAEQYTAAADEYIVQINALDADFAELLDGCEEYFVFGDRFPLLYFFKEYGLNYYAAFPGCGSEVEPSAQTVAFLLNKLADDDTLKTVFYIELSNHKLADTLAADSGTKTALFHTCHNISADDFNAGETYVSLMRHNYDTIKEAINGTDNN